MKSLAGKTHDWEVRNPANAEPITCHLICFLMQCDEAKLELDGLKTAGIFVERQDHLTSLVISLLPLNSVKVEQLLLAAAFEDELCIFYFLHSGVAT